MENIPAESSEPLCISCSNPTSGAHHCLTCNSPCHAIEPCSKRKPGVEYEEGFNTGVTCQNCFEAESALQDEISEPRAPDPKPLPWWKASSSTKPSSKKKSETKVSLSKDLKRKLDKEETPSQGKSAVTCMECYSLSLNGKRKEDTASIARQNPSSMRRHKERWHSKGEKCTVVPSDSPELKQLRLNLREVATPKRKLERSGEVKSNKNTLNRSKATDLIGKEDPSFAEDVSEVEAEDISTKWIDGEKCKNLCKDLNGGEFSDKQTDGGNFEEEIDETMCKQLDGATMQEGCVNEEICIDEDGNDGEQTQNYKRSSTLLKYKKTDTIVEDNKDKTIDEVLEAIAKLSLKVDKINPSIKQQDLLTTINENKGESLVNLRSANNIFELTQKTDLLEFFYDESSEEGILRCVPCHDVNIAANPCIATLYPRDAQQILNKKGSGSISTGLLLRKATTRQLISGHNDIWWKQKHKCLSHLSLIGEGSNVHLKALQKWNAKQKKQKQTISTLNNVFRAAITDLKIGSAARHFETLLSCLALCGADIGNIGHSRKLFPDILYCLDKAVNEQTAMWLKTPLPSTSMPPHFWATVDKGTPSRVTNQAILIVARDSSGTPCPIPVGSPDVYSNLDASFGALAEMITETISQNFGNDILTRLVGVAADGPYQTPSFREKLMELLEIVDEDPENQIVFPVTWDGGHNVNLGITDIKDGESLSATHLNRFIKRCNVFNTLLARGKGYAFLEATGENFLTPISFATQRFASSSFNQWKKIEKSYGAYWRAFDAANAIRAEEEEYQYMIGGFDFVLDLLATLDTMEPIVDLMLRLQSLDGPIWKLKSWWPHVKSTMESTSVQGIFPRVEKAEKAGKIVPGTMYQGVQLLEGWLIQSSEGKGKEKSYSWVEREYQEVKDDHVRFAKDLVESVDKRISATLSSRHIETLEVFDAVGLVNLHCGNRDDKLMSDGDYEEYGVSECRVVLEAMSQHNHIQNSGMDFDPRLAHRYMLKIKDAIGAGIWGGHCNKWFRDKTNEPLENDSQIKRFHKDDSEFSFEAIFIIEFANGKSGRFQLHEQSVYASFYAQKEVYTLAGPQACTIIDFVLSKGGPEAIAESYYSTMRSQQQAGGQQNETLEKRTKLSWCLPSLKNCQHLINQATQTYLSGDESIKAHRINTFFSGRAKSYDVSKVVDRVDAELGRCPFLAHHDD